MKERINTHNYVKPCSEREFALHCEPDILELINEGICRIFAEFPRVSNEKELRQKTILVKLKKEIEHELQKNTKK